MSTWSRWRGEGSARCIETGPSSNATSRTSMAGIRARERLDQPRRVSGREPCCEAIEVGRAWLSAQTRSIHRERLPPPDEYCLCAPPGRSCGPRWPMEAAASGDGKDEEAGPSEAGAATQADLCPWSEYEFKSIFLPPPSSSQAKQLCALKRAEAIAAKRAVGVVNTPPHLIVSVCSCCHWQPVKVRITSLLFPPFPPPHP